MQKKIHDQQIAERFRCSTRTVRRYRRAGININDQLAIVDFISGSKSATDGQLSACKAILESSQQAL